MRLSHIDTKTYESRSKPNQGTSMDKPRNDYIRTAQDE